MKEYKFNNVNDIEKAIDENDGVITLEMKYIRNAFGVKRLGKNVRETISHDLKRRGLAHYPEELPDNQNRSVRLYRRNSIVDDLMRAATSPSEANDKLLIEYATADRSGSKGLVTKLRDIHVQLAELSGIHVQLADILEDLAE